MWIAPFGHLRIDVCLPLPGAFRSLPRPSSAPDAKASSLRSYQLKLSIRRIMSCSQYLSSKNFFLGEVEIVFYPFLKVLPSKNWISYNFLFVVSLFNFQRPLHSPTFQVIEWYLVGTNGLEPSTSRLSGVRSNHLSYAPINLICALSIWWRLRESNPWPPACKAGALPAELNPRFKLPQNWTILNFWAIVNSSCLP